MGHVTQSRGTRLRREQREKTSHEYVAQSASADVYNALTMSLDEIEAFLEHSVSKELGSAAYAAANLIVKEEPNMLPGQLMDIADQIRTKINEGSESEHDPHSLATPSQSCTQCCITGWDILASRLLTEYSTLRATLQCESGCSGWTRR